MKRSLSLLLTAALALSLLAGCGPKSAADGSSSSAPGSSSSQPDKSGDASSGGDTSGASGPSIRFMALSGPTGVGAAKLMADHDADAQNSAIASYEIVTDNTQVQTALANGDVDIAAIATNAAASLYAKTDGGIQVLAVNTLGVLYILEKEIGRAHV